MAGQDVIGRGGHSWGSSGRFASNTQEAPWAQTQGIPLELNSLGNDDPQSLGLPWLLEAATTEMRFIALTILRGIVRAFAKLQQKICSWIGVTQQKCVNEADKTSPRLVTSRPSALSSDTAMNDSSSSEGRYRGHRPRILHFPRRLRWLEKKNDCGMNALACLPADLRRRGAPVPCGSRPEGTGRHMGGYGSMGEGSGDCWQLHE